MSAFRYHAIQGDGSTVHGVVEAEDRRAALRELGRRGLFPSKLEPAGAPAASTTARAVASPGAPISRAPGAGRPLKAVPRPAPVEVPRPASTPLAVPGGRVRRKVITSFTREMSALLGAAIPIPQVLASLGEQEENPVFRSALQQVADAVRKGSSLSAALEEHPRLFSKLYCSMVKVGEEAGALPTVMNDLAGLLEHEDEVRGEVVTAVAYPAFVLGFGIFTVILLLTVVLPRLFGMLEEMMTTLPLPTLILLSVSRFITRYWLFLLLGLGGAGFGLWKFLSTPAGALAWDRVKLRLPILGGVYRAAALGRFARTLGTLARSGVSLLPALRIVEETIGNRVLARQIAQVAEETRGGDSLAAPLRSMALFPRGVVQMIEVGEESGRLDEMLLKVAEIEERGMRNRTKTLISLLAPVLILVVGALVGFMVIALLLPIFRMSRGIH